MTMDDATPHAASVAVRDGRILAVGTSESVACWRGRRTRTVSLDGRAMLPGFIDAHWQMPASDDPDAALRVALDDAVANGFTALRACNLATLTGQSALAVMRTVMDDMPRIRLLTAQTGARAEPPPARWDASALRALTIDAARMCGIDGLTGSIVPGKSADFAIVTHDNALAKGEAVVVQGTWLEGREVYRA